MNDDQDFIFEAVKKNGLSLEFANERFKDDQEIVSEAVKNSGYALQHASGKLKNN